MLKWFESAAKNRKKEKKRKKAKLHFSVNIVECFQNFFLE